MPYIKDEVRDELIGDTATRLADTPGELNFMVTVVCDEYLLNKGVSYSTLNEVIGVLECAKQELYRRVVAPYEDQKCFDNGEVYQSVV